MPRAVAAGTSIFRSRPRHWRSPAGRPVSPRNSGGELIGQLADYGPACRGIRRANSAAEQSVVRIDVVHFGVRASGIRSLRDISAWSPKPEASFGPQLSHTRGSSYNSAFHPGQRCTTQLQGEEMAKFGLLGLGLMGYPMARNLLRAGHEVALWSHNRRQGAATGGGGKGHVLRHPARGRDARRRLHFPVRGDQRDVRAGLPGKGRAHRNGGPGERWWRTPAPVSPAVSRRSGRPWSPRGVDFLDAPCTGSTPGAEGGTLTFMVGGDQKVFEKVRP